jgi:hypothetical protein
VSEGPWSASEWHGAVSARYSLEWLSAAQEEIERIFLEADGLGVPGDFLVKAVLAGCEHGGLIALGVLLDDWQKACASGAGTLPGSTAEN